MSDKYSLLLNKYNRLRANNDDLVGQLLDKVNNAKLLEAKYSALVVHSRVLCKEILAKDPNEMVLGKSYTPTTKMLVMTRL